ncbi:MAG: phosphomannomutase/phosphoglucomutase, partial [Bacteroidales bacterium]|nr:phosphomannomutase/phosphoglucomutase [Bacteroidales bacterium]
MNFSWKDLQNGSDIRGTALSGVAGEVVNLTPEIVYRLGLSLAVWLSAHIARSQNNVTVSVGIDSRLSGPDLKQHFCKGLLESGINVFDFGLATTPSMFMSIVDEKTHCDAAVMITASHLPFNRNGFKFFTSKGGFEKDDITELLSIAENGNFLSGHPQGSMRNLPYIKDYAAYLVSLIKNRVNHPDNF